MKIPALLMGGAAGVVIVYAFELTIQLSVGLPAFAVPGAVASAFGTLCGYVTSLLLPDSKEAE